jgi:hypothetical protein
MLKSSLSGFLQVFADWYVILAGVRNWPGVTPPSRVKCCENWLWFEM